MCRFNIVSGYLLRSVCAYVVLLVFPMAAQAENLLLNDIKAKNGVQLSADELKQLMPNAKVISYSKEGSTRRWTNEPDGKFIASTDLARDVGMRMKGGIQKNAEGTWHVGDNGTYCVTLEWRGRSESWCRYIFKVGEKYYGVKTIADGATMAHEFEFSK